MRYFYALTETVGDFLQPHFPEIKTMFLAALQDAQSLKVRTMAMKSACSLLNFLAGSDEVMLFAELIPSMIEVLKLCIENGEDVEAIEFLDAFGDLAEAAAPVFKTTFQAFVHTLLHAIINENLEVSTRDSAALVVQRLLEFKPKSIGKKGLVLDIINVCIEIISKDTTSAGGMMNAQFAEDEDEEDDDEPSPTKMAQRMLDVMALNMPAKYMDEHILKAAGECMQNPNPSVRKAGTIALGVIAEGCADRLRDKISSILPFLYQSAEDSDPLLREAACFSLGQWAEHLQPEILEHYETLLPIIFKLLDDATPAVKGTSCYVLESLTENMDSAAVKPYLEALMTKLVALVQASKPRVQLMAISAIGSTAVGAEIEFQPYFMGTAHMLTPFLQITDEKYWCLRGRALECMGYMAIAVGKEVFAPCFEASMTYALQSLAMCDAELCDFVFAFFCNVSKIFEEDFGPSLVQVIPAIASAINMDDGMKIKSTGEDEGANLPSFNDQDDEDDEDNEDSDYDPTSQNTIISVRTAMLDMKAGAVSAIQSLAEHTGDAFAPYIPPCIEMLIPMTHYFHDSVRAGAISSLCQCVVVSLDARPMASEWVKGQPNAVALDPITQTILDEVMTKCMEALKDEDQMVVEHALDGIVKMADAIGPLVLFQNMNELMECAIEIVKEDHISQSSADDEDDEEDEDEEVSLLESTCELMTCMCRCYGGAMDSFIQQVMPVLSKYMKGVRPSKDRATVFGCLAEICQEVGVSCVQYADTLVPVVLAGLTDENFNVRQNCAFCLGIFAQVGGAALQPHYASLLTGLRPLFEDEHAGVSDNACAAVARMIKSNPSGVPMDHVLPVFLAKLPLKEDVTELETVFDCLLELVQTEHPLVMSSHLLRVCELFADALGNELLLDEEMLERIAVCIQWLVGRHGSQLQQVLTQLSPLRQQHLTQHVGKKTT